MKQAAVAREIGVVQSMVSRWLRGLAVPEPDNCRRLARLFGESELVVLAMAGHLSRADAPMPERSLADLARELLVRLQGIEAKDGPSTNGPISDHLPSGTIGGIHQRRGAHASIASPAASLARTERWGTTMGDDGYEDWIIEGDWLLPAVSDGEEIRVGQAGQARAGSHVIAMLGERMVTG